MNQHTSVSSLSRAYLSVPQVGQKRPECGALGAYGELCHLITIPRTFPCTCQCWGPWRQNNALSGKARITILHTENGAWEMLEVCWRHCGLHRMAGSLGQGSGSLGRGREVLLSLWERWVESANFQGSSRLGKGGLYWEWHKLYEGTHFLSLSLSRSRALSLSLSCV